MILANEMALVGECPCWWRGEGGHQGASRRMLSLEILVLLLLILLNGYFAMGHERARPKRRRGALARC